MDLSSVTKKDLLTPTLNIMITDAVSSMVAKATETPKVAAAHAVIDCENATEKTK